MARTVQNVMRCTLPAVLVSGIVALLLTGSVAYGAASGSGQSAKCSTDLLSQIKARGVIKIGTWDLPPEAWITPGTKDWHGVDADFGKAIAKELGVRVDPVLMVHVSIPSAIASGRVDTVEGLYYTSKRAEAFRYNKVPYWYGIDALIARKSDKSIHGMTDLRGKTIGVVRGSAQDTEAGTIQEKYGVKTIKEYDTADEMLLDLQSHRIDAAVWFEYTFDWAVKKNPSYPLKLVQTIPPSYLNSKTYPATYFVSKKGCSTASLSKAVDSVLAPMMKNGQAEQILAKYGMTNPSYLTGMPAQ